MEQQNVLALTRHTGNETEPIITMATPSERLAGSLDALKALQQEGKRAFRLETARIHFLLSDALRLSGNWFEAEQQYQQAQSGFEDRKKEPNAEHLLERSDLHAMYSGASRSLSAFR